jgi:hypothetical protein
MEDYRKRGKVSLKINKQMENKWGKDWNIFVISFPDLTNNLISIILNNVG